VVRPSPLGVFFETYSMPPGAGGDVRVCMWVRVLARKFLHASNAGVCQSSLHFVFTLAENGGMQMPSNQRIILEN